MGYSIHAELFAEYGVGLGIIAIRLYARWWSGVRNFYWDDLCLGLVTIFWTMHSVFLYLMDVYGSNIGLDDKTALEVPDDKIPRLRMGAIWAFIAWIAYICLVWSFKSCLLFLYHRITKGLWQHRLMLAVTGICSCTFLASLLLHICGCTPIHKTWQIKPYPGDHCTLRPLNYIVIETLNIVTDLCILGIPFPLILAARIPKAQKVILGILFSSGVFVMIASALRAYYSVSHISNISVALGWASREALVSVIVVSAPGIKPLVAHLRCFESFRSTNHRTPTSGDMFHSKSGNFTAISTQDGGGGGVGGGLGRYYEPEPFELDRFKKSNYFFQENKNRDTAAATKNDDQSANSVEHIIKDSSGVDGVEESPSGGILVTTEYTLAHEDGRSTRGSLD